jgi:magnesium-protoporphyrin O-methyltransferase
MESTVYVDRRRELEEYFDRTAAEAWARLTSDAPVGSIRATVRAGRDRMRATLLGYLPADLHGQRVLDAGCGTGALAVEAARRGAEVVAIDLSQTLVDLARERAPRDLGDGRIHFCVSDMMDPGLGQFDWVVAMDSLIHYQAPEMAEMLALLAARAARGVAFTFAPSTTLLEVMHFVGKAFPRGHRSPDIVPIREAALRQRLADHPDMAGVAIGRTARVKSGFYTSQAMELVRR